MSSMLWQCLAEIDAQPWHNELIKESETDGIKLQSDLEQIL